MNDNHSPKLPIVRKAEQSEITGTENYRYITRVASAVVDATYSLGNRGGQTLSETCMLWAIAKGTLTEDYCSVGQLAEKYNMPKSTVSGYVTRFIGGGLVKEFVSDEDRRRRYLAMSPQGIIITGTLCDKINAAGLHITQLDTVK